MPAKAPERQPLSRDSILAAAIELADNEGVAALSMRNLARRLGFEVMALYNHIANKNDLLSQMVDTVAGEIEAPPSEMEPMRAVRAIAMSTREHSLPPMGVRALVKALARPARSAQMEALLRTLYESGLSDELAHHGFHAVNNHVNGYTLQEQGMTLGDDAEMAEDQIHQYLATLSDEEHPRTIAHVHQHLDGDSSSSFELVLDLILDGLVRLNET